MGSLTVGTDEGRGSAFYSRTRLRVFDLVSQCRLILSLCSELSSGAFTLRHRSATHPFCALAALALLTAAHAEVTRFPANHAIRVSPDTHLVLTFSSPPT